MTFESSTKSSTNSSSRNMMNEPKKHKRTRAYSSSKTTIRKSNNNNNELNSNSFNFNSIITTNNNSNDLLLKNSSSDFSLNNPVMTSGGSSNSFNSNFSLVNNDSFVSDTSSFFSLSTSSPSFIQFNESSRKDSNTNLMPDSSVFDNDSVEIIHILKNYSVSIDKIVLTCLKLISEKNEASKECAVLLTFLSAHKETHDTMMKANCIAVLSNSNNSNEMAQQIRIIINNLKTSGSIKNL